jgi:hypothetical protein
VEEAREGITRLGSTPNTRSLPGRRPRPMII